ncbi:MAG: CARDB domain-containing protein [Candidatus Helarchaeota archaeon]
MRLFLINNEKVILKVVIIILFFNLLFVSSFNIFTIPKMAKSDSISIKNSSFFSPIKWELNWSITKNQTDKWSLDIADLTKNAHNDIISGNLGNISIFNDNKLNETLGLTNNYTTLISIADLDSNSHNELVCANGNNLSIYIYINNLSLMASILVSRNITVLLVKDILRELSGAKKLEIITGDEVGNVTIWRFDMITNKFSIIQSIKFSDKITGMAVNDFTANRNMDLAVVTDSGNFTLLWWNWAPKLVKAYSTIISTTTHNFQIMDLNFDNRRGSELLTCDSNGNISVWKNIPGVAVKIIFTTKIYKAISAMDISDLNNDGIQEILIGTETGNLSIWTVIDNKIDMISSVLTKTNISSIKAGNLDNDPLFEIVVGCLNNLSVYKLHLADLIINSFKIDKIILYRGEVLTATVNISNIGDYPAYNISIGIYWDDITLAYKLGAEKTINILNVGNSTEITLIVPSSMRNILYHWIIARVNNKYSVFESDMTDHQDMRILIRLLGFDWIWVIIIVSILLILITIAIYVLPQFKKEEQTKKSHKKFKTKRKN